MASRFQPEQLDELVKVLRHQRGQLDDEQFQVWVAALVTVGWMADVAPQALPVCVVVVGGLAQRETRDKGGGFGELLHRYNAIMDRYESGGEDA